MAQALDGIQRVAPKDVAAEPELVVPVGLPEEGFFDWTPSRERCYTTLTENVSFVKVVTTTSTGTAPSTPACSGLACSISKVRSVRSAT